MPAFFFHSPLVCLAALLMMGATPQAQAQSCAHPAGSGAFPVSLPLSGTITVGAEVADGTEIYTAQFNSAAANIVICSGAAGSVVPRRLEYVGAIGRESRFPGIYETSMPGVGVAMWYAGTKFPMPFGGITLPGPTLSFNFSKLVDFSLYKIGPISGGVIHGSSLPRARMMTTGAGSINLWESQIVGQLSIVVGTCNVGPVTVEMGSPSSRDFGGAGAGSAWVPFSIGLSGCPAFHGRSAAFQQFDGSLVERPGRRTANRIQIRADPSTAILDTVRSIMALQNASDAGTAKGIGIQVARPDNSPLGFATFQDSALTLTTAANGSYSIPLRARYVQTEDRVRPGRADGAMVVTFRYE
jgi:type 1 fimbria pilin